VGGGGTVGYNYQTGPFVIGFEADFGSIGLSGSSNNNGSWIKQNDSFYADVTGRLGYAFGPALIYAKGGWAYLDNPLTAGFYDYFGGDHTYDGGGSLSGWTFGGGLEYQFSPSWSAKAEYQYFGFGEQTFSYVFNDVEHQRQTTDLTLTTFKVGLNYHFNSIYAPLK
jgi:outer membrane immunogenic protein